MSDQLELRLPLSVCTKRSLEIVDSNKVAIAEMWHRGNSEIERLYADRIVACVNACAGIDTETLDGKLLGVAIVDAYRKLEQQRDELLAALVSSVELLKSCANNILLKENSARSVAEFHILSEHIARLDKAIAKAGAV